MCFLHTDMLPKIIFTQKKMLDAAFSEGAPKRAKITIGGAMGIPKHKGQNYRMSKGIPDSWGPIMDR